MNELDTTKVQVMSSLEIAKLTGKQHSHVVRDIKLMCDEEGLDISKFGHVSKNKQNQTVTSYNLNEEDTLVLVSGYNRALRRAIIKRWKELENKTKKHTTKLEWMKEAVALEEKAIALAIERDKAIKTKAEIGNRREATAMNTASQATKKATKLEIQLDVNNKYSTIKRMSTLTGCVYNWRVLKKAASYLGIKSKDVHDANYGTVKAYHTDVWEQAYNIRIRVKQE